MLIASLKRNRIATRPIGLMMQSEWYYKASHEVHGPCTAGEILRLAADAKVLPQDLVRKGRDGRWIQLTFCEEELKRLADTEQLPTSVAAPAQRRSEPDPATRDVPNHSPAAMATPSAGRMRQSWLKPRTSVLSVLRERWGLIASAALLVSINWYVLKFPHVDKTAERHDLVVGFYKRANQLETNGSAEQWQELAREAHERLDPVVAELQKSADVREPIDQHVLWMARDYLIPLIDDMAVISKNPESKHPNLWVRVEKAKTEIENHNQSIDWIRRKRAKQANH